MTTTRLLVLAIATLTAACAADIDYQPEQDERGDNGKWRKVSRADLQPDIAAAARVDVSPLQRADKGTGKAVYAPAAVSFERYNHQEMYINAGELVGAEIVGVKLERVCAFPEGEDRGWCRSPEDDSYLERMSTGFLSSFDGWTTDWGWDAGVRYDIFIEAAETTDIRIQVGLRADYFDVDTDELSELLEIATALEPTLVDGDWEFEEDVNAADAYRFEIDFQRDLVIEAWNKWTAEQEMAICVIPESGDAQCTLAGSTGIDGATAVMFTGHNPFLDTFAEGRYRILITSEINFIARGATESGAIPEFWCHVGEFE